ncbi:MAG: hypothetical protein FJX71_04160 [Alphaproteobacteria bacterium]|nr:hypothetical protein [Alphaproteobacteria bacterium]
MNIHTYFGYFILTALPTEMFAIDAQLPPQTEIQQQRDKILNKRAPVTAAPGSTEKTLPQRPTPPARPTRPAPPPPVASSPLTIPGGALKAKDTVVGQAKITEARKNAGFEEREKARQQGQMLQKIAPKIETSVKAATKVAGIIPQIVMKINEPEAKAVAIGLKATLVTIEVMGIAASRIILAVGRYKERSQAFLTTNEILINQTVAALRTYEDLVKQEQALLPPDQTEQPSEEQSKVGKAVGFIMSTPTTLIRKVGDTTDALYLTDKKGERWEKLKILREKIIHAISVAEDYVRTLQIKLLQDSISYIDVLLKKDERISEINAFITSLNEQKLEITRKIAPADSKRPSSGTEKQLKDQLFTINKNIAELEGERATLKSFNESPDSLKNDRDILIRKIEDIKPLTTIGKANYIQKKGLDYNTVFSKDGMIELHRQIDSVAAALCSLPNKTEEINRLCKKQS